jgi:hypothetical protein
LPSPYNQWQVGPRSENVPDGGGYDGFDTVDYFDSSASWRDSELAVQQKLGLRTKWRHRSSFGNRLDPVIAQGHLDGCKADC